MQDLFDEVKRPPTPQLETPSSILSMEQVFLRLGSCHGVGGDLGLYDDDQHHSHNVDLDLDVQVEELVLHLPPRCLGSTWSLAYGTDQHGDDDHEFRWS